jgi:Tol biopolymer transport system component
VVDWGYPYANLVTQIDVPTKTYVSNVVYGDAPAWSPDGTRIAYLAPTGGGIVLMNPDATNPRTIAAGVTTIGGGPLAWSPDSKWIIGRGWETIELVNVATGEVLPLPWAFYLRSASWK